MIQWPRGFTTLCPDELPVPGGLDIVPNVNRLLDCPWLRIDATKLTFCDSAGLRCLLDAAVQCQQLGARLDVAASDQLAHTLRLCGIPVAATGDGLLADLTAALTDAVTAKVTRSQPA